MKKSPKILDLSEMPRFYETITPVRMSAEPKAVRSIDGLTPGSGPEKAAESTPPATKRHRGLRLF